MRTDLRLQQPSGGPWTNQFSYDAARRLTSVTSPAGTFSYQLASTVPSRLPIKLWLPNTAYITNVYDSVARLTGTYLKNSGNSTLDSYAYVYDPANERTNLARADGSTVKYKYDKIGQLKLADTSPAVQDYGYGYDAAWNLNYRTNNGSVTPFNVDGKNQLSGGSFAYDDNGNLTNNSSGLSYEYDDENQLVAVQLVTVDDFDVTNGWRTVFVYDGLERLRQRQEFHYESGVAPIIEGGDTPWYFDAKTDYIYDGRRVIQERNTSGNPVMFYTRGTDLSGTLEGAGGIGGLLGCSLGTTNLAYFADGNGNITYLLNSSQSMVASYRYDPFGNTITKSGALADANVYRFSSKEIHVNSGMYYYGFRFYDPALQRWLNRDPLGEFSDLNLYRFVYNMPINLVDALGENAEAPSASNPPPPAAQWPPRKPWPTQPTSADAGKGSIGINSGNAPPARPARPPRPCSDIGLGIRHNFRPSGRIDCPCTGATASCSSFELCVFYSMALDGTQLGNLETHRICSCPEGNYSQ